MIISEAAAKAVPWRRSARQAGPARHRRRRAWYTVIGVVEDVLVDDLRRKSPEPMVYLPGASTSPAYVMKSARADQLAPEVRAIIRESDSELADVSDFTMERLAAKAMASLSFTMVMVGTAAGLSLVLGAVGLYGVLSYGATERMQAMGVRMALIAEGVSCAGCSSGRACGSQSPAWSLGRWRRRQA